MLLSNEELFLSNEYVYDVAVSISYTYEQFISIDYI